MAYPSVLVPNDSDAARNLRGKRRRRRKRASVHVVTTTVNVIPPPGVIPLSTAPLKCVVTARQKKKKRNRRKRACTDPPRAVNDGFPISVNARNVTMDVLQNDVGIRGKIFSIVVEISCECRLIAVP